MLKIRCVILDDELPGLAYLRMLCEQIGDVEIVKCFDSSEQFVSQAAELNFDLCLLDVNMPGINGLDVARKLKRRFVIFVSAHPEYAVDAFDLDAVDFIRKPVVMDRLAKAIDKARKLIEKNNDKKQFSWNTNLGKTIINVDDILYVSTSDVDKRDKSVYLEDASILLLKNITIEKLISLLPQTGFVQINKAEIISMKFVQAHSANEVILRTSNSGSKQKTLVLGDGYRKAFLERLPVM
ncbi:MAG: two-component system response regulator [Bacteroidota bacterium]|jgi:DNA-binding LytR/AlgR family response regulator|nr:two-component system response regulator [Bacteroidota bacterium]